MALEKFGFVGAAKWIVFFTLITVLFLPQSASAQETTVTPLGDGSMYGCALDQWGYYIVRLFDDGYYFEIRYRKARKQIRRLINRLNRQLNLAYWYGDGEDTIAYLNAKLLEAQSLLTEVQNCWNQDDPGSGGGSSPGGGSPGNADAACSVVGDNQQINANIINGAVCSVGNSPVVELELLNGNGQVLSGCTGTAITPRSIVTAAHCLVGGVSGVRVRTGSNTLTAVRFHAHPNFDAPGNASLEVNDLGIVVVGQDLGTRTMSLLGQNNLQAGEQAIIGGYGLDDNGNYGTLRAGFMSVASTTAQSIVSYYNGNGSNTCSGDSGGPFFVARDGQWVLAGVTSNGILENCGVGDESRFTNITAAGNLSFISQYVE